MTRMKRTIAQLTSAAKTALLDAKGPQRGAVVHADPVVVTELFDLGLVGIGDGLTDWGTAVRLGVQREAEDAAFGF